MTDLPAGWQLVRLADLQADEPGAITDGPFGSKLTSAHYSAEGARVVRLQNIGDGKFKPADAFIPWEHYETLRKHEVRSGDLLIASLGDDPPRACLAPDDLGPAIVKADCIRVRLSEGVHPRWVLYAMQTSALKTWAAEQMHGVGRLRLGLKTIRNLPIPLPPPVEQWWIVEFLDDHLSRLDAADSSLRDGRRRSVALQQHAITAALVGGGEASPRGSALAEVGVDDGDLPGLPDRWRWARLGDVADVVGGVTKDSNKQGAADLVEVPYLRVANVQRGHLDLRSVTNIRVPQGKAEALRLRPGDVLLNEGGDRDKLGRGWVWEGQVDGCIHQNHVFRARVRGGVIDPYLLSWAGNTIGGDWCERNGRQSVNLASISLSKIRLMPVPVPPLEEQAAIRARIESVVEGSSRLTAAIRAAEARSSALRRAVLDAAFSGRLTGRSVDADLVEELATKSTADRGVSADHGSLDWSSMAGR